MCSTTDDFITECQGIDDPDVSKMKHNEAAIMQPSETDADTRLQKCSIDAAKMQPHAGDSESENGVKIAQYESESAKTHHSRGEKNGAIDNPTVDHNRNIKSGKFKSNKSQTQSVADVIGREECERPVESPRAVTPRKI